MKPLFKEKSKSRNGMEEEKKQSRSRSVSNIGNKGSRNQQVNGRQTANP
jgi:hypothetical protein